MTLLQQYMRAVLLNHGDTTHLSMNARPRYGIADSAADVLLIVPASWRAFETSPKIVSPQPLGGNIPHLRSIDVLWLLALPYKEGKSLNI